MSGLKGVKIGNGIANSADALAPGTAQTLGLVSASTHSVSAAFGSSARLVRLVATAPCFIAVGATPVATNSTGMYIPANVPQNVIVEPLDKLSVKDAAAPGSLFIVEAVMV